MVYLVARARATGLACRRAWLLPLELGARGARARIGIADGGQREERSEEGGGKRLQGRVSVAAEISLRA